MADVLCSGKHVVTSLVALCVHFSEGVLRDHPLCLVCPDVLSMVGERLSGHGCGSTNHIQFYLFYFQLLIYLFIYSLYKRGAVIQLNK